MRAIRGIRRFVTVAVAVAAMVAGIGGVGPARAFTTTPAFAFDNGAPDGRMGMATRPNDTETEAADDFILTAPTVIDQATFTGIFPTSSSIGISQIVVEIYRVFPKDSNTTRTPAVPTRSNSPSDVEFDGRDSSTGGLSFPGVTVVSNAFTVANSVDTGIHPSPNQTTGGEGPKTGPEMTFTVQFNPPFVLPADHYFFVPQVGVASPAGTHFLWASSARPNPAVNPDLQAWIRNAPLDPDWLRVGTDIVGGTTPPTFNAAFTLSGPPTMTGSNTGTIVVGNGQTVVLNNANQTGSIQVSQGGRLIVLNSTVNGSITSSGASEVELCNSTVSGAVYVNGTNGPVLIGGPSCAGNHIGSTLVVNNTTGRSDIAGNTIGSSLSCSGNTPPPTDDGLPNHSSSRSGQCGSPTF